MARKPKDAPDVNSEDSEAKAQPSGPDYSLTRTMQGDGLGRGPVVGVAKNYKPAKYKTPHGNVREDR